MRILIWLLGLLVFGTPQLARAEIVVAFYSHDLDVGFKTDFPHAFIVVKGETADGRHVDTNYGFTAKSVFPGRFDGIGCRHNGNIARKLLQEKRAAICG